MYLQINHRQYLIVIAMVRLLLIRSGILSFTMPELPEVETIAKRLRAVLPGKIIKKIKVLRNKSFSGNPDELAGSKIIGIERRSKIISIKLLNQQYLLIHLKMTGQLLYVDGAVRLGGGHPTDDFVDSLPSKHTRVEIFFTDKTILYFNDMRVFGWIKLVDETGRNKEFALLAPDITDSEITVEYLLKTFAKRKQPIKQVIMDNSVVAGVGNIYASDALHLARIHPARPALTLSSEEVGRLLTSMQTVIQLGIELGGATIQHYKNVEGLIGHYQDVRRVYAREGEPCRDCGTHILRMKQGGRSTFYCPKCQQI